MRGNHFNTMRTTSPTAQPRGSLSVRQMFDLPGRPVMTPNENVTTAAPVTDEGRGFRWFHLRLKAEVSHRLAARGEPPVLLPDLELLLRPRRRWPSTWGRTVTPFSTSRIS